MYIYGYEDSIMNPLNTIWKKERREKKGLRKHDRMSRLVHIILYTSMGLSQWSLLVLLMYANKIASKNVRQVRLNEAIIVDP
jgi:hypothetical protein